MDPKQSAQLDPKLQEAYNRVMGTTVTPSASDPNAPQPAPASPTSSAPSVTPVTPLEVSPLPAQPSGSPAQPGAEKPLPVAPVVMPHSTETVRIGGATPDQPAPQPTTTVVATTTTRKGISPVILFIGAVVFLLIYSVFWVKFLNVPIPFLNQ